jgi:hypothetical protein
MLRDIRRTIDVAGRHWLGSPKDPEDRSGFFVGIETSPTQSFSAIDLIWTIFGTEQRASARRTGALGHQGAGDGGRWTGF